MGAVITLVIAVAVGIILLPLVNDLTKRTHTLNTVTNESVTMGSAEGPFSFGQVTAAPGSDLTVLNGNPTFCGNATVNLGIPGACNTTAAANGTFQVAATHSDAPFVISYNWEDPTYLDNATERSIAQNIFIMVVLGMFIIAAGIVLSTGLGG